MKDFIKKYKFTLILLVIAVFLDIGAKELFFTILLFYGLIIKLILSDTVSVKLAKILAIGVWIIFIILFGLGYYVNHYMPHGSMIDTGDVVCQNDDQGPCSEKYIEDTRKLNISNWARFFRGSEAELLLFALAFAGIILTNKEKISEYNS